jgi:hypothetical protein
LSHAFQGQGKSPRIKLMEELDNPLNIPELQASASVANPCAGGDSNMRVQLRLTGLHTKCTQLVYQWTVTGGTIVGNGADVTWNLNGAQPGIHKADVKIVSGPGCKCEAFASTRVGVRHSNCTPFQPPTPTPTPIPTPPPSPSPVVTPTPYKITVHYPDSFRNGRDEQTITFDLQQMPTQRASSENDERGNFLSLPELAQ